MAHNVSDRIKALDEIEAEIAACLQSAGQAFQELSKEKSSLKNAEAQTQQFLKSLSSIETKLNEQINHLTQVSTVVPHQGSVYASAKVLQMAQHRVKYIQSRIEKTEILMQLKLLDEKPKEKTIPPDSLEGAPQTSQTSDTETHTIVIE